ncbi:hypothetical protein ACIQNU_08580 [Streptomyces sp. NPDC091292]|uniref:hypothetical protein n=1 Tax=Streptomyces sp. NPDC091292 TaxID=3365991 RepID=UPI003814DEAA
MIPKTISRSTSRSTSRLLLTALAVAPVLALAAACGGVDDTAGGGQKNDTVADVPEAPDASDAPDTGGAKDSGKPSAPAEAKSEFYDAQMTYVACMRAKGGFKDFPDPKLSGHLDWTKINEIGSQPGRNEGIKGGRNGACVKELRAVGAAEPKVDQQKAYESMLAHAQCMRDNGISRFTNPTMSAGNAQPGGQPDPLSRAYDEESPKYKQARKACESKLLDGLDGMQ